MATLVKARSSAWSSLLQLFDIIVAPDVAFKRCISGVPLVPLVAATLVLAMICSFEEYHRLSSAITMTNPGLAGRAQMMTWLVLAIGPIMFVAKWALVSAILFLGCMLVVFDRVTFVQIFTLTVSSQIVQVLNEGIKLTVAGLTGAPALKPVENLGLNLLVQGPPVLHTLLAFASPFVVWYIALLFFGIRAIARCTARQALLALAPYTVLVVLLEVGTEIAKHSSGV